MSFRLRTSLRRGTDMERHKTPDRRARRSLAETVCSSKSRGGPRCRISGSLPLPTCGCETVSLSEMRGRSGKSKG